MTRYRSIIGTVALSLGAASCVQRPQNNAAPTKVAATTISSAKPKSPRINGRGKVSSISLTDFFARQQSGQVLLYDARPGFFYGLGHIPGAISLPQSNCDVQIVAREAEIKAALAEKKTIVIYCTNRLCPDARTVAIHLASFGYSSSTLTGGWETWTESGLAAN